MIIAGGPVFAIVPAIRFADLGMEMAEEHYTQGSMDISAHRKSWAGFITFVKLSLVGILLIMVFLAIFRTH